jgi:PAS domain-containing protein
MHASLTAQDYLDSVLDALRSSTEAHVMLDRLPVPVYTTSADGAVTYWNKSCVEFAGREPEVGNDRWCVTWRLYTTNGDPLPHDQCPMAEAIREKREIPGKIVIAERPDGSRKAFAAYPKPMFDDDGCLKGAVNMLIDVSDEQTDALAEQATRCRRLAMATTDRNVAEMLGSMAVGYDTTADSLRSA